MSKAKGGIKDHPIVAHKEWLAARRKLLAKEKEFTRLRDELNQERRDLPWEKVDKEYVFDAPKGKVTLAELFDGHSQLIVYHFMFDPEWKEGCPHCSFWADNFNGLGVHVRQRDTSMIAISRAPLKKIETFKKRMGWSFEWVSSSKTDFNYDYNVSFTPEQFAQKKAIYNYAKADFEMTEREGISAFYKAENDDVFHTYSTYARGIDMLNTVYNYLDLTAKGRDEDPDSPQSWVRYHHKYKDSAQCCC